MQFLYKAFAIRLLNLSQFSILSLLVVPRKLTFKEVTPFSLNACNRSATKASGPTRDVASKYEDGIAASASDFLLIPVFLLRCFLESEVRDFGSPSNPPSRSSSQTSASSYMIHCLTMFQSYTFLQFPKDSPAVRHPCSVGVLLSYWRKGYKF